MSAGWVAASVRAQAMARRRLGRGAARSLAGSGSVGRAVRVLAATPYGHDVRPDQGLAEAQHAVADTVLWHLRVLAGWAPWDGARLLRVLAAGFEIANVDAMVASLAGAPEAQPFELGALATAWPRLAGAASLTDLRSRMAESPWGDPGEDSAAAIQTGMRLAWARRAAGQVPQAWSLAGAALLVARERFVAGREPPARAADLSGVLLGVSAGASPSFGDLVRSLPRDAAWVFEGVDAPSGMWRGEAAWWRRVEEDGFRMLRSGRFAPERVLGAGAVLAVDAWRVRAALEVAARGGGGLEVFDDVA
ncbi:MAG TPA: hypothetical protein VHO29_12110 [Marmoricola sp.]|nr:hypothetical protein [Marmoricola sp.]